MNIVNLSVSEFVNNLPKKKRSDIQEMVKMLSDLTHVDPKMWGTIIGFGHVTYQYKSGHKGEMPIIGFASRQKAITFYLNCDITRYDLSRLGRFTTGVGCLYVKKLSDIDLGVLEGIILEVIHEIQTMDSIQTVVEPIPV